MVEAELDANADPKSLQVNKSTATIGSLINQMVGGTMLVLPLLFSNIGYLAGTLVMTVTGIIACKANVIYAEHLRPKEMDFIQTINRILGKNYLMIYKICKLVYLFFIIMIYFTLITIQFYSIIAFILESSSNHAEDYFVPTQPGPDGKIPSQFQMDKFNIFYMTFFTLVLCWFLVSIENLTLLIKIAGYGVWTIISFCAFILVIFFYALFRSPKAGQKSFGDAVSGMKLFSFDLGNLAGTAAMAFAVHINSCSALKCNRIQENNVRDVRITYICSYIIYMMIGLLGSMAVTTIDCPTQTAATINDCFAYTNVANLVVILIYLSHLVSAFPIYYNLTRKAFIELFLNDKTPSKKWLQIINGITLFIFAIIQNIPGLKPDDLMSLNGAVCCFFYIYLIPLAMDFTYYHGSNKVKAVIKRSLSFFKLIKKDSDAPQLRASRAQSAKKFEEFDRQYNTDFQKQRLLSNASDHEFQGLNNNKDFSEVTSEMTNEKDLNFEQKQKEFAKKYGYGDEDDDENKKSVDSGDSKGQRQERNMSVYERKQSVNHGIEKKNKTYMMILYCIIGANGLAVLIYEIYSIIANFFK